MTKVICADCSSVLLYIGDGLAACMGCRIVWRLETAIDGRKRE